MIRFYLLKAFTYYNDGGVSPPPPPPPASPPPPPAATFTQEQVNKIMADNKRALQQQNADLVAQLETFRSKANLTQQEKDELDARISTLQQQHLTKEQQLSGELEKANKKYKTDTEVLTQQGQQWQGRFTSLLVTNAILEGSSKHQAASAKQLTAMIAPQVKVVEEVDEAGKPTGNFVPKLPVTVIDPKTKKPVVVELGVVEAIGKMREDPEFANLFLFDGKAGLGGSNQSGGGGSGSPGYNANMTPEQYRKWRAAQSTKK